MTLVTIALASNTWHFRQNSRSVCESGQDVGTMAASEAANGKSRARQMSTGDGRVQNKVALVTGAGSGIGRAVAVLLAKEGASVVVSDVDPDATKNAVVQIAAGGGTAQAMTLDVAEEAAWQGTVDRILHDFERLDVLVNNAGASFAKPVTEMTLGEWRRVMAINLDGVFLGTKYAINAMKPRGGGSIINVASVSGIKPSAGASAYCASKAAVRIFSKTAAVECADAETGIRVNIVTPGGVKTPMWEKMDFFRDLVSEHGGPEEAFAAMAGPEPSHSFFSPDEIAQTILYLASDESSHLTGAELVIDRGHTG